MFWLIGLLLTVVYYIVLIKIDRKKQAAFQIEQRAIPKIKIDASFQSLSQANLNPTETTPETKTEQQVTTPIESKVGKAPETKIEQEPTTPIEPNTEKEIEKEIEEKIPAKIETKPNIEATEIIPPKEEATEIESDKSKIDETVSQKTEVIATEEEEEEEEEPDETTIESNNYLGTTFLEYQANLTRQQIVERIEPYKNQVTLTELDIKSIVAAPLSEKEG